MKFPSAAIRLVRRTVATAIVRTVERVLGVARLRRCYRRVVASMRDRDDVDEFLAVSVRELDLYTDAPDAELERIPERGPLIVVANHPHGIVDGLLLAALLRRRRPDLRVLGNRWLQRMPELAGLLLDVDVLGKHGAARSNTQSMRAAHRWLRDHGGALLVFPAGSISARRWGRRGVHDGAWSAHAARLQQSSGAWVLPIHIGGQNSALFQLAGLVHPRLRTLLIARETMRTRGRTVPVRIGNPIPPGQLERFGEPRELVDYLRLRTEILARRSTRGPTIVRAGGLQPIVAPVAASALQEELDGLPRSQRLVTSGDYEVWCAWAPQAPYLLREIGRLRETTFRAVGEGTGRELDVDDFDARYLHLFVWHRGNRELVGAYRLGHVDKILASHDERGFYTNTLYEYDHRFLQHVTPGLELGRSFVVAAYQREFQPLLLLWRGIATYVARNPRYSTLFGAVSISDRHHAVSKQLMVDHLQRYLEPQLSRLVRPRHPVRRASSESLPSWTDAMVADLGDVSTMVREIEVEGRGVPVLLREYLKLGGRLVGLNVDPKFQHTITALVVIDMRRTAPRLLSRYMGRDEARRFLEHHATPACG